MAMEIMNNVYSSYATQSMAGNSVSGGTKKKETENTSETAGSSKPKSTADYVNELAKLVPSVELKVGNSFQTAKSGKTLTINPKLLEKMQNDPEKEKEMKELIKGVESMTKLMDRINNASGWTVVFRHSYIDENGKYRETALVRNDFMLNMSDKLREERRQNSEKLIEKAKEKSKEKVKEEAKEEEKSAHDKAEQLINDKIAASKDGMIYLNDTDFRTIMEAAREDDAGKAHEKEQQKIGANLDLKA